VKAMTCCQTAVLEMILLTGTGSILGVTTMMCEVLMARIRDGEIDGHREIIGESARGHLGEVDRFLKGIVTDFGSLALA